MGGSGSAQSQRIFLHVDMDAFFAAIEVLDQPQLRGKPLIVGGTPEGRGVVSTASYEARRFGVHSAMPAATAVKLCPHGIFVRPRMGRYIAVSRQVMQILRDFTPQIEPLSCDEAFLDVSGSRRLFGDGPQIAGKIKQRIHDETGLTCSVGVAVNKFLAKLASDLEKPDGLTVVPADDPAGFIAPLPVKHIWGVGPRAQARLHELGIATIGQLAAYPPDALRRQLGDHATDLQALAQARDDRTVITDHARKSVSRETTFGQFLQRRADIERVMLELCEDVARRLRVHGEEGRTVTLKVRDHEFVTFSRSESLVRPTDLAEELFESARRLLSRVDLRNRRVRLLGVGVSHLTVRGVGQMDLFPDPARQKQRRVAEAVDRLKEKLGADAVRRGRLVNGASGAEAGEDG